MFIKMISVTKPYLNVVEKTLSVVSGFEIRYPNPEGYFNLPKSFFEDNDLAVVPEEELTDCSAVVFRGYVEGGLVKIHKTTSAYIVGDEGKTISVVNKARDLPDYNIWVNSGRLNSTWSKTPLNEYFDRFLNLYLEECIIKILPKDIDLNTHHQVTDILAAKNNMTGSCDRKPDTAQNNISITWFRENKGTSKIWRQANQGDIDRHGKDFAYEFITLESGRDPNQAYP